MAEPSRTHGTGTKKAPGLRGPAAVKRAREQLEELTGRPVESVSGLTRTREGWDVVLEVVELERVPPTTDVMATYLVGIDEEGELMGYERVSRYYRNQASDQ